MEYEPIKDFKSIPGWGVDADPEDVPSYPMVQKLDNRKGISWVRPTLQISEVEVLKSTERPDPSAVFGTTVPPKYLSGMIRRLAFKKSEGKYAHWLPLMLADRINVVEGLLEDLLTLKFPNIFVELGGKSEWKYNKKGFFKKTAFLLLVVLALIYFND